MLLKKILTLKRPTTIYIVRELLKSIIMNITSVIFFGLFSHSNYQF